MTDKESALLETLRTMSDPERELLVETLAPQKSSSKKSASKSSAKGAKSKRASSLEGVIQRTPKVKTSNDDEDGPRCTYLMGDDAPCDATEHSPVHKKDGGYLHWHEFVSGKSPASTAERSSSANGGGVSGTASSGTQPESAGSAVHERSSSAGG